MSESAFDMENTTTIWRLMHRKQLARPRWKNSKHYPGIEPSTFGVAVGYGNQR
jgi:hypothetical protein